MQKKTTQKFYPLTIRFTKKKHVNSKREENKLCICACKSINVELNFCQYFPTQQLHFYECILAVGIKWGDVYARHFPKAHLQYEMSGNSLGVH